VSVGVVVRDVRSETMHFARSSRATARCGLLTEFVVMGPIDLRDQRAPTAATVRALVPMENLCAVCFSPAFRAMLARHLER
jgi:hypothetical protein